MALSYLIPVVIFSWPKLGIDELHVTGIQMLAPALGKHGSMRQKICLQLVLPLPVSLQFTALEIASFHIFFLPGYTWSSGNLS